MKKTALVLSSIAVAASLPTYAMAATTVSVSNNGGDSSANVTIQNTINSTSTSTNTSNSHTKVRIETNGEVKEYESNEGEDVHMESEDGSSKVNITNKGTTVKSTATPSVTEVEDHDIQEKVNKATEEAHKKVEKSKSEQKDFFKKFEDWIKNFFKNLF